MQYLLGRYPITEAEENHCLDLLDELGDDWLYDRAIDIYNQYLKPVIDNSFNYPLLDWDNIRCQWNTKITATLGYHKRRRQIHIVELSHRLLLLKNEVIDTVILHELCHILEPNHGHGFWYLVSKANHHFYNIDQRIRHGFKSVIQQYYNH